MGHDEGDLVRLDPGRACESKHDLLQDLGAEAEYFPAVHVDHPVQGPVGRGVLGKWGRWRLRRRAVADGVQSPRPAAVCAQIQGDDLSPLLVVAADQEGAGAVTE